MDTIHARLGAAALVVLLTGSAAAQAAGNPSPPHAAAASRPATRPTAITLAGLARGAKPRIAYVRGTHLDFQVGDFTLVRPDATTLRLPRAPWSEWATMGRGAIGTFGTEAGPMVQQVSGTGHVTTRTSYHFGLAVSPDRLLVGWLVGRLNAPHVVEGGGSRTFDLPRIGHGLRIARVDGSRTCKPRPPENGGCAVLVNTAGNRGVWVSAIPDFVDRLSRPRAVSDGDRRGRQLGLTAAGDWALWGRSARVQWTARRDRLISFAPGARHVLGLGPVDEKTGDVHAVKVYDGSGAVVASYATDARGSISQVAWEDPTHLLATVFEGGRWAVVRLGVDGSVSLATPVVRGRVDYRPYSLPLT